MPETPKKISSRQFRTATIDRAAVAAESRTLTLSFSSEEPVERSFGVEILDHAPESCDLSRLNDGGALLLNHDTECQIGVVESAKIENRRGVAVVRFSKCEDAEEVFQDVLDGIRTKVSVGYCLTDRKMVEVSEEGGKEIYRFKNWQPFEISIVPIPADPTVGVGRAEPDTQPDFELPMKRSILLNPTSEPGLPAPAAPVAAPHIGDSAELVAKRNKERTKEMLAIAAKYRDRIPEAYDLASTALESDQSPSDFARFVIMPKLETPAIPNGGEPMSRDTQTANTGATTTINNRTLGELITGHADYKRLALSLIHI